MPDAPPSNSLPRDPAARLALAEAELARGNAAAAEAAFAQALQLAPNDVRVLQGLAAAASMVGRADGEIWALRRIVEVLPHEALAHAGLGEALRRYQRNDEASAAFFLARQRAPQDRQIRWLAWHTLPVVHADARAFERARTGWDAELAAFEAELAARPPTPAEGLALLLSGTNFHRHYLGGDVVAVQRRYGRILRTLARAAFPAFDAMPPGSGGRRRRIGFVSPHFCEHTVLKLFQRWITGLDPARFERITIPLGVQDDAWTARLRSQVDAHLPPPRRIDALPAAIRELKLDVLVHLDIGMHPYSQLLASLRLAPKQLQAWGHPITSGLDTIDGFVSSAAMEPADGERHYTETLHRLPNLGIDYARPAAPSEYRVALPAGIRGYLFCPQSVHKLHPGHDAAFAAILSRCPDHALVLVPHPLPHLRDALTRRISASLRTAGIDPARQLVVLPKVSYADFLAVARGAALLLDSFGWSGGNTSLEALAQGTPIVTLPGETMRTRHTAAMLGLIDLPELVAADESSYVSTAVAIATEPERRAGLSATIAGRSGALFDDASIAPALAALLE
jgi:protein O-GlcNAc transferase